MGRGRVRSGGGRGGGSGSAGAGLSASQQQDDLVLKYPGAAYVLNRQTSHGVGSAGSVSDEDYPYDSCERLLDSFYDATRLCGSDCSEARFFRRIINSSCGIEMLPDAVLEKKADAAHL